MLSINAHVTQYLEVERPLSVVIDQVTVLALAIAAARFYAGYALLETRIDVDEPYPDIDENTEISDSEWALIKPLFHLFVERETAIQLEASRGLGVDVFGRLTSEIEQDIARVQSEMPMNAFCQPVETI